MPTKNTKKAGTKQQQTEPKVAPTPEEVNEFFDKSLPKGEFYTPQPVNVKTVYEDEGTSEEPMDASDEDEDTAQKIASEQHKENLEQIADELAEADEDTVVYRSQWKGHYLSLPAGDSEETIIAGQLTRRPRKIRCQFKMHLFATSDVETIQVLDKYIDRFKRKKVKSPVLRLAEYQATHIRPIPKSDVDVAEQMDFNMLEEIYRKRQRELEGQQQIKKGTITT